MISQSTPLVVGVDGPERSRDALALAARLADPGQQLLRTLIHGYGGLSNLLRSVLLGSVSRALVPSSRPVVVLPRAADGAGDGR